MSLLVVNSSSRIAQGLLKGALPQFKSVVAADLLPNYQAVQSQIQFLGSLNSSNISELKITERSDLERAIQNASHVLYVQHDYYANVPSKTSFLQHTVNFANQYNKNLVVVEPIEYEHQAVRSMEENKVSDNVTYIRSDLTFGQNSGLVGRMTEAILSGHHFPFRPSSSGVGQGPRPISVEDLSALVNVALQNKLQGKQILAQGEKQVEWTKIQETLQNAINRELEGGNMIQNLVSPLGNNLVSELVWTPEERNYAQFVNQYKPLVSSGHISMQDAGVKLQQNFENYYQNVDAKQYNLGLPSSYWYTH